MDEHAAPARQPVGQCKRRLAQRGQERVEPAETERLLAAPEQHAVFGAHGIGAKPADEQITPLPSDFASGGQPRERQCGIAEQLGRISERFALDDHGHSSGIGKTVNRLERHRIDGLLPARAVEQQGGDQAVPSKVGFGVGFGHKT